MFEALSLREAEVRREEEQLREALRALADSERAEFYRRYNQELKDPDTYAVLNWFFLAGLHHMYLGKILRGLVNLVVMLLGVTLLIVGVSFGLVLIVFIFVLELPALFRSQTIVMHHNNQLARRLLDSGI